MAIPVNGRLDTSGFDPMIRELMRITGADYIQVLRNETRGIIEKTISLTKAASVTGIEVDWLNREWITYNGKRYNLTWTYPAELWQQLVDHRERDLAYRLGARGLSKKTWLQIADRLNIILSKVPNYVRKATWGNRNPVLGDGAAEITGKGVSFILKNISDTVIYTGGAAKIAAAVAGRTKFFNENLSRGVFDDVKQIAAKYPGVQVLN